MSLLVDVEQQHRYQAFKATSQGKHSLFAKTVMETRAGQLANGINGADEQSGGSSIKRSRSPPSPLEGHSSETSISTACKLTRSTFADPVFLAPAKPRPGIVTRAVAQRSLLSALNDTPAPTAPGSPNFGPVRRGSADKINRPRPTTLNIPGLTKSTVSPDGKIAQRDVGAKLVIVMVGLPARGKSYITKKMARYLNWLQHDTRIFNVGERRRVVAGSSTGQASGGGPSGRLDTNRRPSRSTGVPGGLINRLVGMDGPTIAAHALLNGEHAVEMSPEQREQLQREQDQPPIPELQLPDAAENDAVPNEGHVEMLPPAEVMDQSAEFFDPSNQKAALIREQCAIDTLDELLDFILLDNGSVGILDATNSTIERRKLIMKHVRDRAGPDLNVLFMESICVDENLLESNMRLKLSGPDYKGKDPDASLSDFKKRVEIYQKNYVALGDWEEKNNVSYVQMIDVGRKVISHQIKGFLSGQAVYYLLNFNLAPRQIWITRHGESEDNVSGKLGGDSPLTESGRRYAKALTDFCTVERTKWEIHELDRQARSRLPPGPGDHTPPNPYVAPDGDEEHILQKSFCVWTSMLQRSIQTAQYFNEDDFDVKQMRMLDELNAGMFEGFTYEQIKEHNRPEFDHRRQQKLTYRYPGAGGEGYLDVVNRLRPVIVELERMTDHCLLIGHRSVARILLAYFKGLTREDVTDLDVPLGMLYCLEPKPYGVDFKAYRYDPRSETFEFLPGYKLQRANSNVD